MKAIIAVLALVCLASVVQGAMKIPLNRLPAPLRIDRAQSIKRAVAGGAIGVPLTEYSSVRIYLIYKTLKPMEFVFPWCLIMRWKIPTTFQPEPSTFSLLFMPRLIKEC